MSAKKNRVRLHAEERADLEMAARSFRITPLERRRARVLLAADEAQPEGAATDAQIAAQVGVCELTVAAVRRRWCERGEALRAAELPARAACRHGEQKRRATPKLDGAAQARLSALACTPAPAGRKRWTPRLLAFELVAAGVVESISGEAVRLALKNKLKPWLKKMWQFPPKEDARAPRPCAPGQVAKEDNEYVRGGTAAIFLAFAPHQGWRRTEARERRTCQDFAHFVRALLQEDFPAAKRITLVLDNLNTHGPHSLCAAFPPEEAARLRWHFTPKHASWLNMAEIEISVLSRQALAERPGDLDALRTQLAAWQARRNAASGRVSWQFTTADARIKLRSLYPQTLPW